MNFLYCLHDLARDYFYPPAVSPDDAQAVALFTELVNDSEIIVGQRPADFDLVCLGSFDPETGNLVPAKRRVVRGLDCIITTESLA